MEGPSFNLLTDSSEGAAAEGLVAVPLNSLVSALEARAIHAPAHGPGPRVSPLVTAKRVEQAWKEIHAQVQRDRLSESPPNGIAAPVGPVASRPAPPAPALASPPRARLARSAPATPSQPGPLLAVPVPFPNSAPAPASLHDHPELALPASLVPRLDREAFKTVRHVHLQGTFAPQGSLLLTIDHQINLQLQLIQFLMLFVLASHARTRAGLPSPIQLASGRFVSPKRIVELIQDKIQPGEPGLKGLFDNLTPDQLCNPKCVLLDRLAAHGVDRDLIEWVRGSGWRISTPPHLIRITLMDPEDGDETWG